MPVKRWVISLYEARICCAAPSHPRRRLVQKPMRRRTPHRVEGIAARSRNWRRSQRVHALRLGTHRTTSMSTTPPRNRKSLRRAQRRTTPHPVFVNPPPSTAT
jgi:hypothetical protein